jgi:hypothetical protein
MPNSQVGISTTIMLERAPIAEVDQMVVCKRGALMDGSCGSDLPLIDHVEDSETALAPLVLVPNFSIQTAEAKACDNNVGN